MPVNPTGMAMEEVTVVAAVVTTAVVTTAVVAAAVVAAAVVAAAVVAAAVVGAAVVTTAVVAAALRVCRRISRGHHQTRYAYGGETIDYKQGACC
jgi:hypothetical protein